MSSKTRTVSRETDVQGPSHVTLAELRTWSEAGQLPELTASRQERGMRAALAMLDAGIVLLRDRSLDALSVEAICQQAEATVGAFYARFESKRAYFLTIERVICLRAKVRLERFTEVLMLGDPDIDAFCDELVRNTVDGFRRNSGVFCAALLHSDEGMWTLFQQAGDDYRRVLGERLSPLLANVPRVHRGLRIQFAFTTLIGTLIHILLNKPGPLGLDDPKLIKELQRLLAQYLGTGG